MLARVGAEIGIVGRLLGIPAISFDENEYARAQLFISTALAHRVCTGMGYERPLGPKQVRFNGPCRSSSTRTPRTSRPTPTRCGRPASSHPSPTSCCA